MLREFLEKVPRVFGKCSESVGMAVSLAFWSFLCDFRKMFLYALGGGGGICYMKKTYNSKCPLLEPKHKTA